MDDLVAAYKKAHKAELADEIGKKCSGDLRTLLLGKLGKGNSNDGNSNEIMICLASKNSVGRKPSKKVLSFLREIETSGLKKDVERFCYLISGAENKKQQKVCCI